MVQVGSIKPEELQGIENLVLMGNEKMMMVRRVPDSTPALFIAYDMNKTSYIEFETKDTPIPEIMHLLDMNTVIPMIDYHLGDGYRITSIKKKETQQNISNELERIKLNEVKVFNGSKVDKLIFSLRTRHVFEIVITRKIGVSEEKQTLKKEGYIWKAPGVDIEFSEHTVVEYIRGLEKENLLNGLMFKSAPHKDFK